MNGDVDAAVANDAECRVNGECLLETDPESLCLTLVQTVSVLVANASDCDLAFFLIEHLGLFWPGGKEEYSSNTKGGSNDTPAEGWKHVS